MNYTYITLFLNMVQQVIHVKIQWLQTDWLLLPLLWIWWRHDCFHD